MAGELPYRRVQAVTGPAVRKRLVCLTVSWLFIGTPCVSAEQQSDPSFLHGVGQVLDGLVLTLPKTVLEATLAGPPVVGTAIGLLAGAARAVQKTVGGVVEMSSGFDPWGTKRRS